MSEKVQKAIRKEAKKRLDEQLKTMQPQQQPQQTQINILQELDQFLFSCELLTGEKPSTITLTDVAYNAYVQMVQNNAESLGLKPGFKNDEPTFRGIKIVKRSPIVVPTPQETAQISTPEPTN